MEEVTQVMTVNQEMQNGNKETRSTRTVPARVKQRMQ